MFAEDHEILDLIHEAIQKRDAEYPRESQYQSTRESECVEFTDFESGQKYEIVVRMIDEYDRDEDDRDVDYPTVT